MKLATATCVIAVMLIDGVLVVQHKKNLEHQPHEEFTPEQVEDFSPAYAAIYAVTGSMNRANIPFAPLAEDGLDRLDGDGSHSALTFVRG